jgi:hypothetical protein
MGQLATSSLSFLAFAAPLIAVPASFLLLFLKARKNRGFRISHSYVGLALVCMGAAFAVAGLLYLTAFDQSVSFFNLALGLVTTVSGILVYSGVWASWEKNRLRLETGNVLIASAVVILGMTVLFAMYRQLGALVPYDEINSNSRFGTENFNSRARRSLVIEGVFYYPFSSLTSLTGTIALPVLAFGFFHRMRHRY